MDYLCRSLVFQLTNESAIYDVLENITLVYDNFFKYFLLVAGPVIVLVNVFAIFILTRKKLRTSYNIVFLFMALNQGLAILCRVIVNCKHFHFGCSFIYTLPWKIFEMAVTHFGPIFIAHVSWLAVIVTFVRLTHLGSHLVEPPMRFMIVVCLAAFALILVASVPLFLSNDIYWFKLTKLATTCHSDEKNKLVPMVAESSLLYANDCLLLRIRFLSSGVLLNALPCALLVILSFSLAFRLRKIYKNHRKMVARGSKATSSATNTDSQRSSLMITMIVFTTLVTDVPQAAINILTCFLSDRFRFAVAYGLNSIIITLVMIASVINLTIHLCMSRRFRKVTKVHVFCLYRKVTNFASN